MARLQPVFGLRSIGVRLYAVLGVLAVLTIALCMISIADAWREQSAAARAVVTADVTKELFLAMQTARQDRGITSVALAAPTPATSNFTADILKLRERSEAAVARALQALANSGDAAGLDLAAFNRAHDALVGMRKRADEAIAKPGEARDAETVKGWFPAATAFLDQLDAISAQLEKRLALFDPMIERLQEVKRRGWSMRVTAGNELLTLAQLVAARGAPTPKQQELVWQSVGQTRDSWEAISELTANGGVPASLAAAVDTVRKNYWPWVKETRDPVWQTLLSGAPEIGFEEWNRQNLAQLNDIVGIPTAATEASEAVAEERAGAAVSRLLGDGALSVFVVLLCIGGGVVVRRQIVHPVSRLTGSIQLLAEGDYETEIVPVPRRDELGAMRDALGTLRGNAREAAKTAAERQQEQQAALARGQQLEILCRSFDSDSASLLEAVAAASSGMQRNSAAMATAAKRTSERSDAVGEDAGKATATVQTVAAAAEELSGSITEIGRQVQRAATVANDGAQRVERTNEVVAGLADAAQKIGEVIGLIRSIANQTNLLALNATIEAARAGEHGKGFAVVATEVKTLASQTAKATGDISTQVEGIQAVTSDAVTGIQAITGVVREISEIAASIAASVNQQTAATADIARNVQDAANAMQSIAGNVAEVRSVAGEAMGVATKTADASTRLSSENERLRGRMSEFLNRLRAM
ncbi:MAG TPA: HAMP domain-containing methyl-accepting chemotaxis protein [Stellaceae bacterium]|nr:HAMP domain-containing methyl-accepting chemotaxis protein [Stellaceae bacterium]